MLNNLHQIAKAHIGLKPDNHSAGTVNGDGIDTLGFQHAMVVVNSGLNGSSGTADIKVQESSDDSTYTDITGAAFTQIVEANDNAVYVGGILLNPRKRYIRVVGVFATAACDLGAVVLLSNADDQPVTQENTLAFNVKA